MSEYVTDPSMTEMPLQLSEVEQLLASEGRLLAKDPRKVHHFTQRVLATMRLAKQQIQSLHRDVQEIQLQRERAGTATTLSPVDAVRYLTDEQLQAVFGAVARQQIEFLRRQQADTQRAAKAINKELASVKFAVATLLDDPSLPAEAKAKFKALVDKLPEPADERNPDPLPQAPGSQPPSGPTATPARPPTAAPAGFTPPGPADAGRPAAGTDGGGFRPASLPEPPQAATGWDRDTSSRLRAGA